MVIQYERSCRAISLRMALDLRCLNYTIWKVNNRGMTISTADVFSLGSAISDCCTIAHSEMDNLCVSNPTLLVSCRWISGGFFWRNQLKLQKLFTDVDLSLGFNFQDQDQQVNLKERIVADEGLIYGWRLKLYENLS
jgi:hypothetical protein